CMQVLQTPFTV
nr:immunoglobulin light chain junction region [Macaca mulatta]MPN96336.1 immunoglobulin light chain junction region [Macaca mulatta]MPN97894.1 immunoglobulin light chain junction region [Macaca mulatta]MPN98964.1 immunoglobulin light chain junction region [Macaca mulatta]MPN99842.1 immunoglobulin light chain junction region [Macaca mulatta]